MFYLTKEQDIINFINDLNKLAESKKQAKQAMDNCEKIIELNNDLIRKYEYVIKNVQDTNEDYLSLLDGCKAKEEQYEQLFIQCSEEFSRIEQKILDKYRNYTIQIDWDYVATLSSKQQQYLYFDHLAEMIAELPEIDKAEIVLGEHAYTINKKYFDVVKTCHESIKKLSNSTSKNKQESYLENLLDQVKASTGSEKKEANIPYTEHVKRSDDDLDKKEAHVNQKTKAKNGSESYLDDLLAQFPAPPKKENIKKVIKTKTENVNEQKELSNLLGIENQSYVERPVNRFQDFIEEKTTSFDNFMDRVDEMLDAFDEKRAESKEKRREKHNQKLQAIKEKLSSRKQEKMVQTIEPNKDSFDEVDRLDDFTFGKKVESKVNKVLTNLKKNIVKIKDIRKPRIDKKRAVQATAIAAFASFMTGFSISANEVDAQFANINKEIEKEVVTNKQAEEMVEDNNMNEEIALERLHIAETVTAIMEEEIAEENRRAEEIALERFHIVEPSTDSMEEATIEKREGVEVFSPQTSYNYKAINYNADLESLLAMDTIEMVHMFYNDPTKIPSMGVYYDIPLEKHIQDFAHIMELKTGVPASAIMTFAIIGRESRYTLGLESSTGDIGGTQINWYWHAGRIARLGWTKEQVQNEWIPAIDVCMDILKDEMKLYGYASDSHSMENYFGCYNDYIDWQNSSAAIEYAQDCMNRVEIIYSTYYTNEIIEESPEEGMTR